MAGPCQGVDRLVSDAAQICTYEKLRITQENEPAIVRLKAEYAILLAEEKQIVARLQCAPPPGDVRRLRLRVIYYWIVVLLLAVTGFFSTMLSFAPFRLGWMSLLVSAGLAMLTPFLVDRLLETPGMERMIRTLTAVTSVAALASLMLLALIRGDILAQQIREAETQSIVIDDAQPQTEPTNTFYDHATACLCAALLLMAFATELGGGLALHAAWHSMPDGSEDWAALRRELVEVRKRLAAIASEVTALRNASEVFAARYWRDFYRALLLGATRNAITKLLFILLVALAFTARCAHAEDRLNLVIAIDLTRSVATIGADHKTDFQKNIDGVNQLLAVAPAGSRISVIGITEHSFSQPYILLSARISDDAGYFGERLTAARSQLVRAWAKRSGNLTPSFQRTDILGALQLANEIFDQQPDASHRTLVIFSDMRQSTPDLDLEASKIVPPFATMATRCGIPPSLQNVRGYVLGVDGAGRSSVYWFSLQQFWKDYFQNAGAVLKSYSVLREMPQVTQGILR